MSTATVYLVVEATRAKWRDANRETGLCPVDSLRVVAMRTNRPATLKADQIAVKVRLEVPDSAFNPLTPIAVIVVPEEMALRGPITADVQDAEVVGP